jgi:hypothetical protein
VARQVLSVTTFAIGVLTSTVTPPSTGCATLTTPPNARILCLMDSRVRLLRFWVGRCSVPDTLGCASIALFRSAQEALVIGLERDAVTAIELVGTIGQDRLVQRRICRTPEQLVRLIDQGLRSGAWITTAVGSAH